MEFYGITDIGLVRKQNQDAYHCGTVSLINGALLIVCDGMGGAKSGNIASTMTLDVFKDNVAEKIEIFGDENSVARVMTESAELANRVVYDYSCANSDCTGMGTTIVAAMVVNKHAVILNVGDSRAYLLKRTGEITQITKDHSMVEEMVASGEITREEAKRHPNRNLITRAVGTTYAIQSDIFHVEMKDGDRLLLCSDGLSNVVEDSVLAREALKSNDLRHCCEGLITTALNRGASDNITAVLFSI